MAALSSTLLPPGLVLCLGLLFSTCMADYSDNCSVFKEILSSPGPTFQVDHNIYESNETYKVTLPVNKNTSFVVLKALDKNNHPVGSWQNADKLCRDSALYEVNTTNEVSFWAYWISPMYRNVTTVKLQVFVVNLNRAATVSSLELKEETNSTVSPSTTSTTRPPNTQASSRSPNTPAPTSATVRVLSTTLSTTTTSSASRAFLGPITDAMQILLLFLTSKLLF
ncbi:placenta-expressed transcript 1 protein [Sorex araneus]|uniref:placenta-expressed transcript 1 protein n=1 Tax=Sorex araneus TaxID=42254 RepID=UPI002433DF8D|nr:placenta-expressed transcript 1 protein [Sorex araneus]